MGRYLNPGMESFEKSVNSEIYVDKTGIEVILVMIRN